MIPPSFCTPFPPSSYISSFESAYNLTEGKLEPSFWLEPNVIPNLDPKEKRDVRDPFIRNGLRGQCLATCMALSD